MERCLSFYLHRFSLERNARRQTQGQPASGQKSQWLGWERFALCTVWIFFLAHAFNAFEKKKLCQIIEECHVLPSRPHCAAMRTKCGLQRPVPRLTSKEIPPNDHAKRMSGFSSMLSHSPKQFWMVHLQSCEEQSCQSWNRITRQHTRGAAGQHLGPVLSQRPALLPMTPEPKGKVHTTGWFCSQPSCFLLRKARGFMVATGMIFHGYFLPYFHLFSPRICF